jgi:NADP-dependent alcohol dehydrogenase
MGGPGLFPIVSFLNPEVVKSIPRRQLVNGLMDSFTHVLEQYLTYPTNAMVQDGYSESLLKSVIKLAPRLLNEPYNEVNAGNFMWICSMALNGQLGKGVPTDWSTHIIGHELTALYNIDHAVTLAIVFPNLWKNQFENKKEKLAQYAENVWNIQEGSIDEKARKAIQCTEDFISSLQIDVRLSSYSLEYKKAANIIKENLKSRGLTRLGEKGTITPEVAERIIEMCY